LKTYLLIPLIEVVFGLALLIALLINGRRHAARRPFFIFLVFLTLWGIFMFMTRFTAGTGVALPWEKLALASIMIASALFYWSVISLISSRPNLYFLYGMGAAYIMVLALVPAGFVVSDIKTLWYGEAPVIGPLYFFYLMTAYTPVAYSAVLLVRHGRQTRNIDFRVRDRYLIAGIIAMLTGALADYLSALGVSMYPLGIIGNIVLCIMATAAMLKYTLLEMRVLLRNGVTFLLTSLLIFGVFGSLIYLMHYLFLDFGNYFGITVAMMVVFLAALMFRPVFSRLSNTVDRWFFRKRYDHIQTMKRFSADQGTDRPRPGVFHPGQCRGQRHAEPRCLSAVAFADKRLVRYLCLFRVEEPRSTVLSRR